MSSRPARHPEVAVIATLAQEELGAVATGRYDALSELHARRQAALDRLPVELTESERAELMDALLLQRQIERVIERDRDRLAERLQGLDRRRTAARAYGSTGTRPSVLKPR